MKHKKFEIIMIKNTLAMMLPIMVLLLVLIFVGVRYSLFHVVQCYELTKIEPIVLTKILIISELLFIF